MNAENLIFSEYKSCFGERIEKWKGRHVSSNDYLIPQGLFQDTIISKKDNPSEDQFAGPLIAKAERMDKEDEALKNHIRFIMRGGFGEQVNTNGYRLQYENAVPKSVTITLNPMKNDWQSCWQMIPS